MGVIKTWRGVVIAFLVIFGGLWLLSSANVGDIFPRVIIIR